MKFRLGDKLISKKKDFSCIVDYVGDYSIILRLPQIKDTLWYSLVETSPVYIGDYFYTEKELRLLKLENLYKL